MFSSSRHPTFASITLLEEGSSRLMLFATISLVLILPPSVHTKESSFYTNPVMDPDFGADPAVLYYEGLYYAYTTNREGRVAISEDLVNWKMGPVVMPEGLEKAWAPEVYRHPNDGKFYLYYTDKYKIGVAVADRPDAEFENLGYLIIPAIDGHLFRDDDKQLYLYFTVTPQFAVYCLPMYSPTEPGGPAVKCFEISQEWEKNDFSVNEGPWMFKRDGTYHLFYSGNDGQTAEYGVGYATAPTPMGPFTKHTGNPVVASSDKIWGPGHGSFTKDRAGRWWHLYHQKTGKEKGWKRMICLDPLEEDETMGAIWSIPTKGVEQPAPLTDSNAIWTPEISPRGALFTGEEQITITCPAPDTTIRYTIDGTEPDKDSPLYGGPITISGNTTVKARAFRSDAEYSAVERMRFFRMDEKVAQPVITDIPSGNPPFRVYPSPALIAPKPRPAKRTPET